MFSIRTKLEEFEIAKITSHIGFVFEENSELALSYRVASGEAAIWEMWTRFFP